MRTFAQKPKTLERSTPAKTAIPGRPKLASDSDSTATAAGRFGHDFSRMRVHAAAPVAAPLASTTGSVLRRKCSACEASARDEEAEIVVRRQHDPSTGALRQELRGVPIGDRLFQSAGQPLGEDVRAMFEPGFGRSLADVRVRTDADAAHAANALHARAFTVGSSIWFGAGEYRPDTSDGRRLLAHEVAHTVQQAGAAVGAQAKLTIGRTDDPAEKAADEAADAVLRGASTSLPTGGVTTLRREAKDGASECKATSTSPTTVTVKCGDREFHVTATPVTERRPATQVSAIPDIDATDISLEVSICRGSNEVKIKPSVNLPAALQSAISNALSGRTIGNVTITPNLRISWLQSERFDVSVTGGPNVDVSTGKVTGGSVGVDFDTGDVKVGGNVTFGPDGKPTGIGGTIGTSTKPKTVDCYKDHIELQLSCESVTTTPGKPAVLGTDPKAVDEQLEIFFEYMTTKIRDGELPPKSRLDELTAQGARVVSIDGFASPEGPRKRGPGFIGNNQLSTDRAAAAESWLRQHAPQLIPPTYAPASSTVGRGEIGPPDVNGREPAVPAQDVTYPALRRATIHLTRTIAGTPGQQATPDTTKTEGVECPDNVKRAARKVLRNP